MRMCLKNWKEIYYDRYNKLLFKEGDSIFKMAE